MPWIAPKFKAEFNGKLIDNLIALILAGQPYALPWASGGALEITDAFVRVEKAFRVSDAYPFCVVVAGPSTYEESEQESYISEQHTIYFYLGITGNDPEQLEDRIKFYARAVDTIVRSAKPAELTAHMTAAVHGRLFWDMVETVPGQIIPAESKTHLAKYLKTMRMKMIVQITET